MDETNINPTISSFFMDEYDHMGMNFDEMNMNPSSDAHG
jgi:hypothetical protein